MAQEPKEWVNASRRSYGKKRGGMHAYIDADTLSYALQEAGISLSANLAIKRYPLKTKGKIARVLIKIKEVDNDSQRQT